MNETFQTYLPHGELFVNQQNSTYDTRYKFSAKELDNETGYNYHHARYLDTDLSVWLSVDPLADERPNFSPYNYCQNNPVMRVDLNGMLDWIPPLEGGTAWTAEAGDNAWTLHEDAGISYDHAKSTMKSQGFDFSNNDTHVDVQIGDAVNLRANFTTSNQTNYNTNGVIAPWSNDIITAKYNEVMKYLDGTNQTVGYGVSLVGLAIDDIKFLNAAGKGTFYLGLGIAVLRTDWKNTQSVTELGIGTSLSTWAYLCPWAIPFAGVYSAILMNKEYAKTLPERASDGYKSSNQQIKNHPYFKDLK